MSQLSDILTPLYKLLLLAGVDAFPEHVKPSKLAKFLQRTMSILITASSIFMCALLTWCANRSRKIMRAMEILILLGFMTCYIGVKQNGYQLQTLFKLAESCIIQDRTLQLWSIMVHRFQVVIILSVVGEFLAISVFSIAVVPIDNACIFIIDLVFRFLWVVAARLPMTLLGILFIVAKYQTALLVSTEHILTPGGSKLSPRQRFRLGMKTCMQVNLLTQAMNASFSPVILVACISQILIACVAVALSIALPDFSERAWILSLLAMTFTGFPTWLIFGWFFISAAACMFLSTISFFSYVHDSLMVVPRLGCILQFEGFLVSYEQGMFFLATFSCRKHFMKHFIVEKCQVLVGACCCEIMVVISQIACASP